MANAKLRRYELVFLIQPEAEEEAPKEDPNEKSVEDLRAESEKKEAEVLQQHLGNIEFF